MIRFTFKYLRPIALFLAIVVLFQCCKVYDKKPVSVEQAISEKRIKVITKDGREYVFNHIYYKNDSVLYGLTRKKTSEIKEIIIPKDQIKQQVYKGNNYGGTDTFITVDQKKYNFESYYFKNDTLYGLQKARHQKEILIPIKKIKKIKLYNSKKSTTATVFLAVGSGVGLLFLGWFIAFMIAASNSEGW